MASTSSSVASFLSVRRSTPSLRRKSSTSPLKINMASEAEQISERERTKLAIIEAQQIIAVIDDALLSLQVVSRISSVCENHEYFESFLGRELSTAFIHLCTSLSYPFDGEERGLISRLGLLDSNAVENIKHLPAQQKLNAYSKPALRRIRDLIKKIVKLLLQKRSLFNMICGDTKPSPTLVDFIFQLEELRRFAYDKLTMANVKYKRATKYFREAASREEGYKKEINRLEEELGVVKNAATKEISALKEKIATLEDDIEKMVTISSEAILQKRIDTIAEIDNADRVSNAERTALENALKEIKNQYAKELKQNRLNERNLRIKNFKLETEVERWIEKYDRDMEIRLARYDEINNEFMKEQDELRQLEAEFAPIQEAYNALMEERAEKERALQLQLDYEALLHGAATVIQKHIRRWLAMIFVRRLRAKRARAKAKHRTR